MKNYKKWLSVLLITLGVIVEVIFGNKVSVRADEPVYGGFVVTDGGVMYLNADGTPATDCWLDLPDGRRYHMDKNGYIQLGMTQVDGKTYYLWYTGTMTTGWLALGEDNYFFLDDGTMAVDTEIGGYRFGSDGRLLPEEEEEVQEETPVEELSSPLAVATASIISSVTTEEMTNMEKLSACYRHMVGSYSYKRTYDTIAGEWTEAFALDLFTTGKGNCYRYAAGFAALAKGLGFEAKVVTGRVKARKGGTTPHGWTEVLIGNNWYIFDSELQSALGRDLYMKTYDNYPVKPLVKEAEWEIHF